MWGECIPGTAGAKTELAKQQLASCWARRTRTQPKPSDHISQSVWLSIAREAIIEQLGAKSGLQLKITHNAYSVFCRVRSPAKLLEVQADLNNYKLQFRKEIDPGSEEFWNREVQNDDGEFVAVI